MDVITEAARRPTRLGRGGRPYIGPKAQTTIHEALWDVTFAEAEKRGVPHTEVMREVIYAGLLASRRATRKQIDEACVAAGIDPSTVRTHLVMGEA